MGPFAEYWVGRGSLSDQYVPDAGDLVHDFCWGNDCVPPH